MSLTNEEALKQGDELYERYGKPLEAGHWGEFVAISKQGQIVVGEDLAEVQHRSHEKLGAGVFVFKIGEKHIGRLRSPVKAIVVSKEIDSALGDEEALEKSNALYERYGKPLEDEHWGKFVAIAPDGKIVLGTDMDEVFFDACETLGEEFIQFKVGPRAVGRI